MQKKPKILVVGSFVMDIIATTEVIPGRGQAVYGKEFHMAPGGKGANQAVQCARLGADVTLCGCVGDDIFAEELLRIPQEANIHMEHVVRRSGVSSGIGHITLEVTGNTAQNRIVILPGANRTLTVEEVSWIKDEISTYDIVLLQLELPIEVNRAIARWAKEAGVPVMLNPAPATELDDELLTYVSYLTPNEQEASTEMHLPLRTEKDGPYEQDIQAIADALKKKGVQHVIITLGSSGSVVVREDSLCFISPVHMPHVVDPTAAGDSFCGALCVGLTVGMTEEQALNFASHTAAITVSRMGAMPSLPVLQEVLDLMKERNYQGVDFTLFDCLH